MGLSERNKGISRFAGDMLAKDGLPLYEKWFDHLQKLSPDQKIRDTEVRDQMVDEIVSLASEGNSLILTHKDKTMVEDLVNRFLKSEHLLKPE